MKLTEIKFELIEQLKEYSIDDYYYDAEFIKKIFIKITGLNSMHKIEEFLHTKLPEVSIEIKRNKINQEIENLNTEKSKIRENINSLKKGEQSKTDLYNKNVKQQEVNNTQQNQIKHDLSVISNDYKQIETLSDDSIKTKSLDELNTKATNKNAELKTLKETLSKLSLKNKEEKKELQAIKDEISNGMKELKVLEQQTIKAKNNLKQLNKQCKTESNQEFGSLKFLFNVVLAEDIEIVDEYVTEWSNNQSFNPYGNGISKSERIKTGQKTLEKNELKDFISLLKRYVHHDNINPASVSSILKQALEKPFLTLSGVRLIDCWSNNIIGYKKEEIALTHFDISALLATKIALNSFPFLKIQNNKLAIPLSGGIMMVVSLRKMGKLLKSEELEIFRTEINDGHNESKSILDQNLYQINGYTNSTISVQTPHSFIILFDSYIIEIEYAPAPILFQTNTITKLSVDVSSRAMKEDELAREEEEERRRQEDDYWEDVRRQEDDDYWDDDYY